MKVFSLSVRAFQALVSHAPFLPRRYRWLGLQLGSAASSCFLAEDRREHLDASFELQADLELWELCSAINEILAFNGHPELCFLHQEDSMYVTQSA